MQTWVCTDNPYVSDPYNSEGQEGLVGRRDLLKCGEVLLRAVIGLIWYPIERLNR